MTDHHPTHQHGTRTDTGTDTETTTGPGGGDGCSDEELLAGCTVGDLSGLAELHRRHSEAMRQTATWALANRVDVDDVVQHALLYAAEHAAAFRGEASVRTWLRSITRNLVRRVRTTPAVPGTPSPVPWP